MRPSLRRYLVSTAAARPRREAAVLEEAGLAAAAPERREPPPELSWHDYAVFLLHVASEVEHALMVQYLYAAYSLGGTTVAGDQHEKARQWREVILGIAKEEMGHLITVQNILRLIGGPLHLEREDYPFRSEFYPFHFVLEPATKASLAKYVIAEAPEDWLETPAAAEIKERARRADDGREILPVGVLYRELIAVFEDEEVLTAADFRTDTAPYQASWDEWARGYGAGERGNIGREFPPKTPDVRVLPAIDRASTVKALINIAQQGEAPVGANDELSHFSRFLRIYEAFPEENPPSRNIPTNPTAEPAPEDEIPTYGPLGCARITNARSQLWANLFNLRYRKLLFTLKHAFHVEEGDPVDRPTARGNLIAWTFGEMYNLRSIASILVSLPLDKDGGDARAGPPFQAPYTLALPDWDSDKWRVHRDLINGAAKLIGQLDVAGETHRTYLRALKDHDELAMQIVERLLNAQERLEAIQ
ncbi:MAG TPA: ferritin-like domain-containing protein [Thermoanaerobaculia bacterium]|nr:ferritin-like domain-containing protein [Thermoanaerobaculia bacterium]